MTLRRLWRRLLCRVGLHRYQYMLAPPSWRKGDDYEPGLWCLWCCHKHPTWNRDKLRL